MVPITPLRLVPIQRYRQLILSIQTLSLIHISFDLVCPAPLHPPSWRWRLPGMGGSVQEGWSWPRRRMTSVSYTHLKSEYLERPAMYVIGKLLGNINVGEDYPPPYLGEILEELDKDEIDDEYRRQLFRCV